MTNEIKNQNSSTFFLIQILFAILFGMSIFLIAAGIFITSYQVKYDGRIFPGVMINNIDLSGLGFEEASQVIQEGLDYSSKTSITLTDGNKSWGFTPLDLGLFLDSEGIYLKAFEVGRNGSWLEKLKDQYRSYRYEVNISPQYVLDERLALLRIAPLSEEIDRDLLEASLSLIGNNINMQNGQIGRFLDVHQTVSQIEPYLHNQETISLELPITEYLPAILDVTEQAEKIEQILSQDLYLSLPSQYADVGGPWVIDQEEIISMLTVELSTDDDGSEYSIGLDDTYLLYLLNEIAKEFDVKPVNSRFYFDDDTRELVLVASSVDGRELNIELSLEKILTDVLNQSHSVELLVDIVSPDATNSSTAADLGITELVSAQTSYFYGSSAGRIQNVTAAASKFYGYLIAPGETFSMGDNIGDISLDTGFAEALIIYNGRTIKGVGGGVCQVSTTLFRTVFFGGFPVEERYPHAYRVYYYEMGFNGVNDSSMAGLDATVYTPLIDFKFTNDTDYWLLLETYVNPTDKTLTWKFYSTSDGRSVDWSTTGLEDTKPPKDPVYEVNEDLEKGEVRQVDWAVEGASVTVSRTVYKEGAVHFSDFFKTTYRPWQTVCQYGPDTENYPPAEDKQDPYSCGSK